MTLIQTNPPLVTVVVRYQDAAVTSALADALGIPSADLTDVAIVAAGPPRVVADLIERLSPNDTETGANPVPPAWADLTDRERVVASMAGHGLTDQQIGNRLHITTNTVNYHLRQIYRKLAIHSRVCLARLVPPDPPAAPPSRPGGPR
jgi:DNA-binding NarL/FixJ family response regulator